MTMSRVAVRETDREITRELVDQEIIEVRIWTAQLAYAEVQLAIQILAEKRLEYAKSPSHYRQAAERNYHAAVKEGK
jgi:hypothetical protein